MSRFGVQNKKRITVIKPRKPVAMTLVRILLPAITLCFLVNSAVWFEMFKSYLAFLVSSAMSPAASNPVRAKPVNTL